MKKFAHVQPLEPRQLLASVTINGSSSGEDIRVYVQSNTIVSDVGGIIQSYPDFLYDGIVINALGGADTIRVESNTDNRVTVNGGNGTDSIYLGNGVLDGVESPVTVSSSAGDVLYLDDSGNASGPSYACTGGTVTSSFPFAGVTYTGIAGVHILAGSGADVFNVYNTIGIPITIDGGGGDDVLELNSFATGTAEVIFDSNQDFAQLNGNAGGVLRVLGDAGVLITSNLSNFEANLFLERGFVIERNSQSAGGLNYWRDRLVGAMNNTSPQLRSTFADSTSINDAVGYGYKQNTAVSTLGGFALNNGDLILRYTLRGDVDLSGTVDFDDLLKVAQNYSDVTTGRQWTQGDFNLSGKVDFDDLLPLAQNYGATAAVGKRRAFARPNSAILV